MGMNSMFSGFTNFDTTLNPDNLNSSCRPDQILNRVNLNKPYEILDVNNQVKGYFWYYGNSIDLKFNVEGEVTLLDDDTYITINDLISELEVRATIYDFRLEPIFTFSNNLDEVNKLIINKDDMTILLQIDSNKSKKMVRGKYYIDLYVTHPSGYNETLFGTDTCVFEVR